MKDHRLITAKAGGIDRKGDTQAMTTPKWTTCRYCGTVPVSQPIPRYGKPPYMTPMVAHRTRNYPYPIADPEPPRSIDSEHMFRVCVVQMRSSVASQALFRHRIFEQPFAHQAAA